MHLLTLFLCLLLFAGTLPAAEVVLSAREESPAIKTFTEALKARRPQDKVSFLPAHRLENAHLRADSRLVLLDPELLPQRLTQHAGTPTLVLRISRVQAHQALGGRRPTDLTLLWSDPPLERQLQLIRLLLPTSQRIGVLYSTQSEFLLDELNKAASDLDLEIVAREWPDNRDSRPVQQLLSTSDLILGLDDAALFNLHTVKNLLLSSYAHQRALIGPTIGFVRAGSLASTYSDQNDWLDTLDRLLDMPVDQWPREQYPSHFKVQGNRQVARALGIELADDAVLERRLEAGEKRP